MTVLLSHPTGNSFVRALLAGLQQEQMLDSFYTTIAVAKDDPVVSLLPAQLQSQLRRRAYDLPADKIRTLPWRESVRLLVQNALPGVEPLLPLTVDAVYQELDAEVSAALRRRKNTLRAVYCYEDGAFRTFKAATQVGLRRIYELPIAYWKALHELLNEEAERWPQWTRTLGSTSDPPDKLERKDAELSMADLIICPSEFVRKTIPAQANATAPQVVAPFGSPLSAPPRRMPVGSREKLRVLFAGTMSQRKGLADLFAAMKLLPDRNLELVVLGQPVLPLNFYKRQFEPNSSRGGRSVPFIWERPRAQSEVFQLMSTCDVLVLPSIVEGRALVQQEAMTCGLPLIATENAGGSDLIEDAKTGFLIPIRDPRSIAEKLAWCDDHRDELQAMSSQAQETARRVTWDAYRAIIIQAIRTCLLEEAKR